MRLLMFLFLLAFTKAAAASPLPACLLERPRPAAEEIAARKVRVAATESKARKLSHGLHAELKSSSPSTVKRIRADIEEVEGILVRLRELQDREYCDTRSPTALAYVTEVVRRIEECGTRNFPNDNGTRVYGSAEGEFVVGADGVLVSDRILKSSKNAVIDQHVSMLIRASAPFSNVPEALAEGKYRYFIFREKFSFLRSQDKKLFEPNSRCRL
jgi:periplasmic protein TonB